MKPNNARRDADIDHIECKLTDFFHKAALFEQIISKEIPITVEGPINH